MFENETQDNIIDRMLSNLSDEIDKREGSVAADMLTPKSIELAMAYIELDNVLKFGFANTSYGEFLDMKVSEAGIVRRQASKATGHVTLTPQVSDSLTIPKGTALFSDTNIKFLTDEQVILKDKSVEVKIIAEIGGRDGNVPANSITAIDISNVECTNSKATSGGLDIESDEILLERYHTKVRTPGVSGNKNHYKQWATEVSGIGSAKVIPLWNGESTVKVIVVDLNKQPVPEAKVTEVFDYIETVRPVGATVTVESAVTRDINLSFKVTLAPGATLDSLTEEIDQKIKEYFNEIAFVEDHVKYSRIGMILLSVEGIVDYSDLLLNNYAGNVYLADNQIPVLGVVDAT